MKARLHDKPIRRPVRGQPWSLQPVSKIVRDRPLEFIRLRSWTAAPARFGNGVSAVTSLCVADEPSAGGPPLVIAGDEDGGVSVRRVPAYATGEGADAKSWSMGLGEPRRARLHDAGVNSIKILPQQRGFVCAGDDGILSVVETLEVDASSDLRTVTTVLTGHRGFVTECDTLSCGQAILSSSTDGRMLIWDPMASKTPVVSITVGRPVNSACFSAGDPYALVCAPELERSPPGKGGCGFSDGGRDDLVQIWDVRSLRCFRDAIPAALATAFTEACATPQSPLTDMQPPSHSPQAPFPSIWEHNASWQSTPVRIPRARMPNRGPSWLVAALESSSAPSPATPLLRRSAWADDGSNTESLTTPGNGCLLGWSRLWATPTSEGPSEKENSHPYAAGGDLGSSEGDERASEPCRRPSPGTIMRCQSADLPLPLEVCKGGGEDRRPSNSCTARATGRDEPASVLGQASLPSDSIGVGGCLHGGDGTTWLPGGKTTWSSSSSSSSRRRPRAACNRRLRRVVGYGTEPGEVASISARAVLPRQCAACSGGLTSVYNVQVSSDGRGILTASRDATVTLWDAQSRRVTYRFGHPRLSTRARPILWDEDSSAGGVGGLAGEEAGRGSGRRMVITGMKDGELRPWRVGSRFPNRVFKSARRHEGFEVTCLASSRDGSVFASADCGGNVCVQSATAFGVAERTVTR
ncbi:unnamed protein product [Ascophyllum nodosum]